MVKQRRYASARPVDGTSVVDSAREEYGLSHRFMRRLPEIVLGRLPRRSGTRADRPADQVPAAPGGAWDQTAHAIEHALVESGTALSVGVINTRWARYKRLRRIREPAGRRAEPAHRARPADARRARTCEAEPCHRKRHAGRPAHGGIFRDRRAGRVPDRHGARSRGGAEGRPRQGDLGRRRARQRSTTSSRPSSPRRREPNPPASPTRLLRAGRDDRQSRGG